MLTKIILYYRPNGRSWLGRPSKRLLEKAETGSSRPNSWWMMMMMIFDHASFICRFVKPHLHCVESSHGKEFWIYLWLKTVISVIVMVDYCTYRTVVPLWTHIWVFLGGSDRVYIGQPWWHWSMGERGSNDWTSGLYLCAIVTRFFCCCFCCCFCWFPGLWHCVVLSVIPTFQRDILPPLSR